MTNIRVAHLYLPLLIIFGMFSSGLAAEAERTALGLTTRTGSNSLPFVIAEEKGFFKNEGTNTIVLVMQNLVVLTGVATKNVDYGGTFSNFVGGALSGLPVRIVMAVMDGSDHVLVTSPGIKKVEELKGKIIGTSSFGSTSHSEISMVLRKHGMNPEKDVTFLQIGGSASRFAAMESNAVQAAMLVPPFNSFAKKHGFNQFLSNNEIIYSLLLGPSVHTQRIKEK